MFGGVQWWGRPTYILVELEIYLLHGVSLAARFEHDICLRSMHVHCIRDKDDFQPRQGRNLLL